MGMEKHGDPKQLRYIVCQDEALVIQDDCGILADRTRYRDGGGLNSAKSKFLPGRPASPNYTCERYNMRHSIHSRYSGDCCSLRDPRKSKENPGGCKCLTNLTLSVTSREKVDKTGAVMDHALGVVGGSLCRIGLAELPVADGSISQNSDCL